MPIIQKVTDPAKRVTDSLVLRELAKQGMDKDYVEFWHDYAPRSKGKENSPYAKFYRDLKSNKKFMVVSGLPMVKPDGTKIEVGWQYIDGKYQSKANLFSVIIEGKQVKLICLSDQPNGTKKDEQVTWQPQLFVGGSEIVNGKQSTLLPVDPVNENNKENTLEWGYGTVCKRRIRIIEGRFRERWIFESNPHSKVRIKHNFVGSLKLRLGRAVDAEGNPLQVTIIDDEEIIEATEFDKAVYPVEIGASLTVYPDVSSGNTTVDGRTARHGQTEDWAVIKAGAGTYSDDDGLYLYVLIESTGTTNKWKQIDRALMLYDTSGLGAAAVISAATESLRCDLKYDNLNITPEYNIFASTPADNNVLVNADYSQHGTTPFATAIAHADWDAGDVNFNDFAFVQAGLDAISKTGITKTSLRDGTYDAGASTPTWVSNATTAIRCWTADKGSGYKPKLVVTYSIPVVVTPSTLALTLAEYAPTIAISDHITVTPSTLTLTLTAYAPVLNISDHQIVIPTTLPLSLTAFAPKVIIGVIVAPGTKALTLNTFAPTVSTPVVITPPALALILTAYVPTVLTPRLVTPSTLALTLTLYAPIFGGGVVPTTLALSLTSYAPILKLSVIPSTLALSLTSYAPSAIIGFIVTPSTKALTFTTYAPVLKLSVIPSTLALILTAYAPTVLTPRLVTPSILALLLMTYIPTALTPRLVTPDTLELVLTPYAPRLWSSFKKLRLHPYAYTEGRTVEL